LAYGQLGLTSERFWGVDASELFKALKGFNDLEEARAKREFEVGRYIAQKSLAPYMKNMPKNFWKLPWDKAETRNEFLKRHESFNEVWDRL
jgi:hypothetical protein